MFTVAVSKYRRTTIFLKKAIRCSFAILGHIDYTRIGIKSHLTGDINEYKLKTAPQFGAELLINDHYRFEQNYSLILGGGLNIPGYNFDYNVPNNRFDPPTTANITTNRAASREMTIIYFRIPFELERGFGTHQNNEWVFRAGGSLLISVQQP